LHENSARAIAFLFPIEPENLRVAIMPEDAGETQKMEKVGRRGQIRLPVRAEA
jgi:hypothetical protein